MNERPELHSTIVAMISLASGIASRHPDMGLCQLKKLREAGVPEHQIATVVEIARHIRDEAARQLDAAFDEKAQLDQPEPAPKKSGGLPGLKVETGESCCTPTPGGQSCC